MTAPVNDLDPLFGVTVFVTAARTGSFTQAAERLGLTKSAVGKTVAKLEQRLGVRLFFRTTRVSRLTPDGEAFFATCSTAVDEIAATRAALASSHQVLTGRLRMDMPVFFGRRVLLPVLMEIIRPHPGLTLSLNFRDRTIAPAEDDFDISIRVGPLQDADHLVSRKLCEQPRVICASPDYLREHGTPRTVAELRHHRCIVGAPKGAPPNWWVREDDAVRQFAPPATHRLSDGEAMVDATAAGLGLCQLPSSLVRRHLESGALVPVLSAFSTVPIEFFALWPRQAHLSPRVRHVVDQLVTYAERGRLD